PQLVSEKRRKAYRRTDPPRARDTVFFHPDCDRRLRHLTGSADPVHVTVAKRSRARALRPYRRWGIAPRPEDVCGCRKTGRRIVPAAPRDWLNVKIPLQFARRNMTLRPPPATGGSK